MTQRVFNTEVLDVWFRSKMADVHTAIPAEVLAYSASDQTVDVRPQISRYLYDEDDVQAAEALPDLYKVPVAFPRGGGFHLAFPIAVGDYVLVICSEEPTIAWRAKGRKVEAGIQDRHGLNGCFAIPAGYPDTDKIGTAPSSANAQLSADDGDASVTVKPSEVLLGDNTASEYVALANLVDTIFTTIDTVIRTSWTPLATDGGAALKTAWTTAFASPPSSVAAAKTKAK